MTELTLDRLKQLLSYDPLTGLFTRLVGRSGGGKAGSVAGCVKTYVEIKIDGVGYLAHRLAWFYMTGSWPASDIDHEDTDKHNNRWINLRKATDSQNRANISVQKNNKLGVKGVSPYRGKFRTSIRVNGKGIALGTYNTVTEASAAYERAASIGFGEFARVA